MDSQPGTWSSYLIKIVLGLWDMSNLAGQSAISQQYSMCHPPLLVILWDFTMRLVVLRIVPDPEGHHDQQVSLTIVPYNEYTMGSHRSVDELATFYIFRWVNNVFHILLFFLYIIVWFGPNCLGKNTPSFRIYDMIKKIMPKCLSHHAFIIV